MLLKSDWSEHDAKLVVNIKTLDHVLMSSQLTTAQSKVELTQKHKHNGSLVHNLPHSSCVSHSSDYKWIWNTTKLHRHFRKSKNFPQTDVYFDPMWIWVISRWKESEREKTAGADKSVHAFFFAFCVRWILSMSSNQASNEWHQRWNQIHAIMSTIVSRKSHIIITHPFLANVVGCVRV